MQTIFRSFFYFMDIQPIISAALFKDSKLVEQVPIITIDNNSAIEKVDTALSLKKPPGYVEIVIVTII